MSTSSLQATEGQYKNKGAYIVLEPPHFDSPVFHSFEAITPRPTVRIFANLYSREQSHSIGPLLLSFLKVVLFFRYKNKAASSITCETISHQFKDLNRSLICCKRKSQKIMLKSAFYFT